jgi:hypothetical protein
MANADNLIWLSLGALLGAYAYHYFLKVMLWWMDRSKGRKRRPQQRKSSGLLNFGKPRPFQIGDLELLYAPEHPMKGYKRELFGPGLHVMVKGEKISPRDAALLQYGSDVKVVGTAIVSGTWECPYTGKIMNHPREIEIDHVVPLSEAWRSGADEWTTSARTTFARDPANLVPVAKEVNREKSGSDIGAWLPTYNRDTYLTHWLNIKGAYQLSFDNREIKTLGKAVKS